MADDPNGIAPMHHGGPQGRPGVWQEIWQGCQNCYILSGMQLELFPFQKLSQAEFRREVSLMRNSYWHLRNSRGRFAQAANRRHYRKVAEQKKRLQLAGVSKREILDLLRCCRQQCGRHRHPFEPCQFCA